jgi:leader peptidase (prepilin peptidase) / N-methyltransferase
MASLLLFPLGLVAGVFAEAAATRTPIRELREGSKRVPLVAVATGLLFAATPVVMGVAWVLPAYLWFVTLTVTLTLTDLDDKLIPNRILFPGTAIGLILLYAGMGLDVWFGDATLGWLGVLRPLIGGAVYYGLMLILALVGPAGGMGGGDVKLAFLLGVFTAAVSFGVLVVAVLAAFIGGGLVSIFLIVFRRRGRKDAIPFGPYMIGGAYVALAWGGVIADWYLGST